MGHWWEEPGADVKTARVAHDVTIECPICQRTATGQLILYFPRPHGKLLGYRLPCNDTLDAEDFHLPVVSDGDGVTEFEGGTYPVTLLDDETGKKDIVGLKVVSTQGKEEK